MNKKSLILISILFLLILTAVSAQENSSTAVNSTDDASLEIINTDIFNATSTDNDRLQVKDSDSLAKSDGQNKLETTYYYDAEENRDYIDDTMITHNVVKYYGDKSKKFKVKVFDDDYNTAKGIYVSFGRSTKEVVEKKTNKYGNVYFSINYKVGKHRVVTYIECVNDDDGEVNDNYYYAVNRVTIKSTIPTKKLTKYNTQTNKKFSIKFLTTKGKPLKKRLVKIKVRGKTYKIRTNSKGIAKITINSFKVGKHKITAINPFSKEKRKITVKIKAKKVKKTYRKSYSAGSYIGNKNTHKFHYSYCHYVRLMKPYNKVYLTYSQAKSWGYVACKKCKP